MPNYTTNLNLEKPLQSEQYNIDVFNANADKIDQFAGQTPPYALTANSLRVGAKINGVNFKGDTDVVTGAGFYYDTVTYGAGDLAFIYNQNDGLELHKSLQNGNIGHNPLTSTGYWEKQDLGGSGGRNVGEIITSTLPLTDAGLHLLDGSRLSGDGIYKEFADYIANLYNDTKVYNPSAFTVVGSPTITADGVASGFSEKSILQFPNTNLQNANTWEIEGVVKGISRGVSDDKVWLSPISDNGIMLPIATQIGSTEVEYQLYLSSTKTSWDIASGDSIKFPSGSIVKCNLKFTGTQYIYTCTNLNTGEVKQIVKNSTLKVYQSPTQLGRKRNASNLKEGELIYLKQFSITVDGKEVFSGSKPANYFTDETTWQNSVTTYGSCGKFVYDSTLNTVRLPKVSDILQGTTDVNALGDLVEAGLPIPSHTHTRGSMNITGSTAQDGKTQSPARGALYNGKGAFYSDGTATRKIYGAGDSKSISDATFYFDASRSWTGSTSQPNDLPSIYGNSSTVQPQTIKAFYYIVIATSTKTDIEVDIDEIATDLNGKADTDLTNVTNSAKVLMSGMGMPSDKYIDLTLGASGATYTAPANGWIYVRKSAGASNKYLNVGKSEAYISRTSSGDNNELTILFPFIKGEKIYIDYNAIGETYLFRFYYAQGSESEAS